MIYTENLNLPIVEDDDSMSLVYTQGNETNQKLEEKFAGFDSIPTTLNSLQESVNSVNTEIVTVKTDMETLKTSETNLSNRIEVLEDARNKTDITVAGVKKSGTHHRVKLTATPTTSHNVVRVPIYNNDTDILYIRNYTANVSINMNDVLGINSLDNIIMLGVGTYQSSHIYQGSTNVIPMMLKSMGKAPGNNDLTMYLTGTYTDIAKRPVEDSSSLVYPQLGDVEIIIEYMVLD